MQLGCWAFEDIIHVSAQPVTPSEGITDSTGTFSTYCWFTGHAVPMTMSPDSKPSISSVYTAQYLLTLPAYSEPGSNTTSQLDGVWVTSSVLYMRKFGPHMYGTP